MLSQKYIFLFKNKKNSRFIAPSCEDVFQNVNRCFPVCQQKFSNLCGDRGCVEMGHGTQMTLIIQIYTDILTLNTIDHQLYSYP